MITASVVTPGLGNGAWPVERSQLTITSRGDDDRGGTSADRE